MNITINRLNTIMTTDSIGSVKKSITDISNEMPFLIGLTTDERVTLPKINESNKVFVGDSINARITYRDIQPGHYKVLISGRGQTSVVKDSIWVGQGQKLVLNFKINGPCLYDHPAGYIPTCPKNHTDSIIPIIYGLVAKTIKWGTKNKKEVEARYAGCVVTDCDPQFYCKEHDIEF